MEEEHSISGTSISDSNIEWRNWLTKHKEASEIAQNVWEMGKIMGMSCNGDEAEIVAHLAEMEKRDRKPAGKEVAS